MSQTIRRTPVRHDEQQAEWVSLYHREGVPVRPDGHPIENEQPGEWGWHGEMGKWGRRLWLVPFALVVAYLVTDLRQSAEGKTAAVWLIATGLLMLLLVVVNWRRRKNAWRSQ